MERPRRLPRWMLPFLRNLGWTCLVASAALGAAAMPARAEPKDSAAMRLAEDALANDYLTLHFDAAAKKLRRALQLCGSSGCGAKARARVHRDLGVVLVAGLHELEAGKKEFVEAVRADPSVALDKDLATPEIEQAFEAAKGGKGAAPMGAKAGASTRGDLVHSPPAEQALLTPVPLYVEAPEGVITRKVLVLYKPFGSSDWQKIELRPMARGYGGEIPCQAVNVTGDLSYFVQVVDAEGDVVTTSGSRTDPNLVTIKRVITEVPHLPGQPPPARCRDKADCPPGFPGCAAPTKTAAAKGWGRECERDRDCDEGLTCKAGRCETGEKSAASGDLLANRSCDRSSECAAGEICGDDKTCRTVPAARKVTWLGLHVQQDFSLGGAQSEVCGSPAYEAPPDMTCTNENGTAYAGVPDFSDGTRNATGAGPHVSTLRLLLDATRFLGENVSVGARVGYALRARPGPSKLHLEGRVAYHFGHAVRPYVAAVGGVAEMSERYDVPIAETLCQTDVACQGKGLSPHPTLTAWRTSGRWFGGVATGASVPLSPGQALLVEARSQAFFPGGALAISPSVGYTIGF